MIKTRAVRTVAYLTLLLLIFSITQVQGAPLPAPPTIKAKAYLLMDFNSDQVLAVKNADKQIEPASLTKLMTAYIVFNELKSETLSLDEKVRVSEKAWRMKGSRMFIEVNNKVSVEDLLKGMIIQSGNDATIALAEQIAGSESAFVEMMNDYALDLGMTNTHFVNSTGMPNRKHKTTVNDLAKLTNAIIRDFPEYYKWYSEKEYTYNNITQNNRNLLLWRDKYVDGVKTGHTESAGFCLIASALRDNMRLVSIVVGAKGNESRAKESQKLLNYGFRYFETSRLYTGKTQLTTARVWKGEIEVLPLGIDEDLFVTIPKKLKKKLDTEINVESGITAPTLQGDQFGTLEVKLDGKHFVARPLIALRDVPEGGITQKIKDNIILLFQ